MTTQPLAPIAGALLTRQQAAAFLGLSVKTLHNAASRGDGPPFVYVGTRSPRYIPEQLRDWLDARTVAHTTEADAKGLTPRGRRQLAARG